MRQQSVPTGQAAAGSRRMRQQPSCAVAVVLAAAILLAACGTEESASPSSGGGASATTAAGAGPATTAGATGTTGGEAGPATNLTACDVVTAADVRSVTGARVGKGTATEGPANHITLCQYFDANLLVRFSPEIGPAEAEANRQPSAKTVAGLGDDAYWFTDTSAGVPQIVFSVVKGDAQVYLLSGTIKLAGLQRLAKAALARLG